MERLTLPAVCDLAKGQDIREIKALNASHKNIKHVDDIRYGVDMQRETVWLLTLTIIALVWSWRS